MPEYLNVQTHSRVEMVDVTTALGNVLSSNVPKGWIDGFLVVYSPHTTCGVTINEGWDPDVKRDMMDLFSKYIPRDGGFRHADGVFSSGRYLNFLLLPTVPAASGHTPVMMSSPEWVAS